MNFRKIMNIANDKAHSTVMNTLNSATWSNLLVGSFYETGF